MKEYKIIIAGLTLIAIAISMPGADPLRVMVFAGLGTISAALFRIFK